MTITTTMAPTTTFARVQNEFNRMLEMSMNTEALPTVAQRHGQVLPSLNVYEDAATIFVEAELPGVPLDDVDVAVVGNQLTITGQRTLLVPDAAALITKERGSLKFQRTVLLSQPIIEDGIVAVMRKGILIISLPKATRVASHNVRRMG
jgi:HSP20 family protein